MARSGRLWLGVDGSYEEQWCKDYNAFERREGGCRLFCPALPVCQCSSSPEVDSRPIESKNICCDWLLARHSTAPTRELLLTNSASLMLTSDSLWLPETRTSTRTLLYCKAIAPLLQLCLTLAINYTIHKILI